MKITHHIMAAMFGATLAGGLIVVERMPGAALPAQAPAALSCDTDAECAALPACALKPGCDGGPTSEPFRLIGYGCDGAAGPIYRDEEDEFPRCDRIEPAN